MGVRSLTGGSFMKFYARKSIIRWNGNWVTNVLILSKQRWILGHGLWSHEVDQVNLQLSG